MRPFVGGLSLLEHLLVATKPYFAVHRRRTRRAAATATAAAAVVGRLDVDWTLEALEAVHTRNEPLGQPNPIRQTLVRTLTYDTKLIAPCIKTPVLSMPQPPQPHMSQIQYQI